jgi:transposase
MARRIQLQPHLSVDQLERRYRAAKEPHERSWWQILWLLGRGQSAGQVAQVTGYSRYWIGQLAKRYNAQGPAGMRNRQHTTSRRAPPLLSAERQEELRQALQGPTPEGSRRWTARAVAAWMAVRLGRPVGVQRGWDYLQRLKHSQQLPRPRHALADPAEREAFKKNSARS